MSSSLHRRLFSRRRIGHVRKSKPAARRLFFEPLEARALLSGSGWSAGLTSLPSGGLFAAGGVSGGLSVEGTSGDDLVVLRQNSRGRVVVTVNGQQRSPVAASRVVVDALAGDDVVRVTGRFTKSVELRGGDGDDVLQGGPKADLLLGGAGGDVLRGGGGGDVLAGDEGDDRLYGQAGRDLVVGGAGADRLEGSDQDDVLVAGPTVHDADAAALQTILARWNGRGSYAARQQRLSGPSAAQPRLDAASVYDDQAADQLVGGRDKDLYFMGGSDALVNRGWSEHVVKTDTAMPATGPSIANRAVVAKPGVQQMPSVAVNPHDPNHVVIAYMDYSLPTADTDLPGEGYAGIGVAVSHDGGDKWQYSAIPLPAGFDQGAANPIAKFDDQGRVFVSFMAATFLGEKAELTNPTFEFDRRKPGFQANNGVFVGRSDDGGLTWQQPTAVTSHLYDGTNKVNFEIIPDLAIDTFRNLPSGQSNPDYGNLYVSWTRAYAPGLYPGHPEFIGSTDIMFAVSRDGGQSWQIQLQNRGGVAVSVIQEQFSGIDGGPGSGPVDQAHLAIGPGGDIYVSHFSGGDFGIHHSTDSGASFDAPDHGTGVRVAFSLGYTTYSTGTPLHNHFRTHAKRAIVADPSRPGHIYAAEPIIVQDASGNTIDGADVFFARSTDYGVTWQTTFQVGPNSARVLNDDNDGQQATGLTNDEVISGQAFSQLAVDAQGNIALVWYDARRDVEDHLLDVFGAVSTDGGESFSKNFRVTNASFDADAGAFTDPTEKKNFYLGDFLGLAISDGNVHAAWTDTRLGNQDVFVTRYSLDSPPAPPNDRFEPNNAPQQDHTPTDLGRLVRRVLPKLSIPADDQDWFHFTTAATGNLTISALQSLPGEKLSLELWNEDATVRFASGANLQDDLGKTIGKKLDFATSAGRSFLVRVLPLGAGEARYSLELQALTADFGTRVHGVQNGSLALGDEAIYLLRAATAGSLEVTSTSAAGFQGDLNLEVLGQDGQTILAAGQSTGPPGSGEVERASVPVETGQAVLLRLRGEAPTTGSFSLEFTNLDQFSTPQNASLLFPAGAGPGEIAKGDFNGDQRPDLVVSNAFSDTISVLLGDGDGTFEAPRQFAIGAFVTALGDNNLALPTFGRAVAVADFDRDGEQDVVVTNYASADVSVLLGRGDGTFETQRRFNATAGPRDVDVADFDNDNIPDLVVTDITATPFRTHVSILIGQGNGNFKPETTFDFAVGSPAFTQSAIAIADFDRDGNKDLAIGGNDDPHNTVSVFLGNGKGKFTFKSSLSSVSKGIALAVADLNSDGIPDLAVAGIDGTAATVHLGNGDGTFAALIDPFSEQPFFPAGQLPTDLAIVDFGSEVFLSSGAAALGPPDGHPDIVVANTGVTRPGQVAGGPEVVVLPGVFDGNGKLFRFGAPKQLATGKAPQSLDVADLNADGFADVAAVDRDGVRVIYGKPPIIGTNSTRPTARDLGTVVHVVEPTLTITPVQTESWFKFKVPGEAGGAAGDQVVDISALIEHAEGAGLGVELQDGSGKIVASSERMRVKLAQGAEMFLRVFARQGAGGQLGAGAYMARSNESATPQLTGIDKFGISRADGPRDLFHI